MEDRNSDPAGFLFNSGSVIHDYGSADHMKYLRVPTAIYRDPWIWNAGPYLATWYGSGSATMSETWQHKMSGTKYHSLIQPDVPELRVKVQLVAASAVSISTWPYLVFLPHTVHEYWRRSWIWTGTGRNWRSVRSPSAPTEMPSLKRRDKRKQLRYRKTEPRRDTTKPS